MAQWTPTPINRSTMGDLAADEEFQPMSVPATPIPLTDLSKRVNEARALILDLLTELIGPVELDYDFYREWNGCWKVRVDIRGAATGRLEFTLLETPAGAILALPRPLPERWRTETGIRAGDGSRWSLDPTGQLVPFVG
jgi:hypothetical protein